LEISRKTTQKIFLKTLRRPVLTPMVISTFFSEVVTSNLYSFKMLLHNKNLVYVPQLLLAVLFFVDMFLWRPFCLKLTIMFVKVPRLGHTKH